MVAGTAHREWPVFDYNEIDGWYARWRGEQPEIVRVGREPARAKVEEEVNVNDDEVAVEMSLPLDSDGFLRRECPTCEREFKWFDTPEGEDTAAPVADGGYFCPYCGVQADASTWLSKAQAELVHQLLASQVLGPMLEKFGDDLKSIGRQSGGIINVEVTHDTPDEPDPLADVDDMTRVDFTCHPTEPIKVLDDWNKPVFCLICGQPHSL